MQINETNEDILFVTSLGLGNEQPLLTRGRQSGRSREKEREGEKGMENQHELETGYDEFCQKMRRRPRGARNGETDEANRERRIKKERKGEGETRKREIGRESERPSRRNNQP